MAKRRQPERAIQAQIVHLLKSLGARVYVLGTTRRKGDYQGTMMTAGLPDLMAFLPHGRVSGDGWILLIVEVKAPKGRMSKPQRDFRENCLCAGVEHIAGGLDEVFSWLIQNKYLRQDQVRSAAS